MSRPLHTDRHTETIQLKVLTYMYAYSMVHTYASLATYSIRTVSKHRNVWYVVTQPKIMVLFLLPTHTPTHTYARTHAHTHTHTHRLFSSVLVPTGNSDDCATVATIRLMPEATSYAHIQYFTQCFEHLGVEGLYARDVGEHGCGVLVDTGLCGLWLSDCHLFAYMYIRVFCL